MTPPLAGRVAIVTGGGRGIGLSLVHQLAEAGARLVINDLDEEPAEAAAAAVRATGGEAIAFVGSVTGSEFAHSCLAAAMQAFGDIHIIVPNAGYVWNGPIGRQSDEQWDAMHDVHLKAPFRLLRAFDPLLRKRVLAERTAGHHIMRKVVTIMSVSATCGAAEQIGYSSAKAGLYGLTRTLAKEWGPLGVNVNAVAYGLIDTRLTRVDENRQYIDVAGRSYRVGFRAEIANAIYANIALGRAGTPEEAAAAALMMCLPNSDYVSGQILRVDGGLAA